MRKVVWLAAGVLILQLGFILSYVAAFHQPEPREIPIAVVAEQGLPAGVDSDTADKLNAIDGTPLDARTAASTGDARAMIRNREVLGAYVLSPTGTDTLITASAAGSSIASSLEAIFTKVDQSQNRTFVVRDDIPVSIHDNRGLSGFYLSVGWVVGGYLLAAAIGLLIGAPKSLREASAQFGVIVGYSILSGILGAFITTHVVGTFAGHWFPLALLGTAVVLATALFTLGLRAAVGIAAVPIAIIVFVILGNPSAGGAFGPNVLPEFYSAVGRWITPGVGTEGVRSIVYFSGTGLGQPALALVLYTVIGLALFFGFTYRRQQKSSNLPVDA
ncbi:hypothetical protein E5720_12300 [Rhodococcus sp. PAMC28707]|uniref:hypothetical protein n=1 Tax=unclassified Rhodococcus (in: high G+C Gram-positive bacteria) TaxID=192944 RepID=UPI00109DCFA5|nr:MULTISPECIES: hypothetical protein [unclassified Rhodococcus (in: high G+C Gram-positive bacteria)]QCB49149.1 hypothetical protein E5769_01715 [Rhodococcus sp. PAMC28705]QCB59163.1 hypothetical protein E5720_12300 [Rhodococcus sp. PAMC28707]